MSTQVVQNGFYRRDEVMETLGVSDATIERMVRDERLRSKLLPVPGRKAERVFVAEDVERLRAQKEKRRALAPPSAQATGQGSEAAAVATLKPGNGFTLQNLRELIGSWAERREEIGIREKLWLSWDEAATLSGIPAPYVRRAAAAGEIVAKRFGRAWRVQRKSLEAYEG